MSKQKHTCNPYSDTTVFTTSDLIQLCYTTFDDFKTSLNTAHMLRTIQSIEHSKYLLLQLLQILSVLRQRLSAESFQDFELLLEDCFLG